MLSARARQNGWPSSSTDSCGHPCRPSGFSAAPADGLHPEGEVPEYVNNRSLQGYLLVIKKERCLAFGSSSYLGLGDELDEVRVKSGILLNLICNSV